MYSNFLNIASDITPRHFPWEPGAGQETRTCTHEYVQYEISEQYRVIGRRGGMDEGTLLEEAKNNEQEMSTLMVRGRESVVRCLA